MVSQPLGTFLRRLRHTLDPDGGRLSDAQLLERFVRQRDEAAFEVLVWRHGGLILHVCRRLLQHDQDREDVFQATFLALTRKAAAICKREALASWLYKVAYRAALRVRTRAAREITGQQDHLASLASPPAVCGGGLPLWADVDAEINRLPEKYRVPVILCYLNGKSTQEAAQQLGCPRGTVCSRLAWARQRLRRRLTRRGLTLSAFLTRAMAPPAAPAALISTTVRAAVLMASKQATGGPLSARSIALAEGVLRTMLVTKLKMTALGLLVLGVLGLGTGVGTRFLRAEQPGEEEAPTLVRGSSDGIHLPPEMLAKIGIQVGQIKPRAVMMQRTLRLPGSTALDPDSLVRVRLRCAPFEVIEIGKKVGDKVSKGQVLAVVSSGEVAQKKSDLFTALVQLKLDQRILAKAEKSAASVPEVFQLNARRNVQADRNAVNRARNALKTLGVPDDDIEGISQEATEAGRKATPDTEDMGQERLKQWARVVLRAPIDGTLVERNVHLGEMVVNNAVNLFQIANLDRLLVIANAPEDELPNFEGLKIAERRWTVQAGGSPPIEGVIEEIGYLIDPQQHTSVLKGHIRAKDHGLRAGQFVTVSITLPLATGEVQLPAAAVVTEGGQTFVFVQPDARQFIYEQRRVLVVRRGQDTVHIRGKLTSEQERQGFQTLQLGDRVTTAGALELKAMLDDLKPH
jgi:cobalt-zinc-cadmium efflux system membrane fusion protein